MHEWYSYTTYIGIVLILGHDMLIKTENGGSTDSLKS